MGLVWYKFCLGAIQKLDLCNFYIDNNDLKEVGRKAMETISAMSKFCSIFDV